MKIRILLSIISIALFAEDACIQGSTSRGAAKHREHGGVGYDTGYTTLEAFLTPNWKKSFQPFLDARGHILNNGTFASNLGVGMRYLLEPNTWALGGNFYFDFRDLGKQNAYQFGLGLEALSENIDFRANGYLPFSRTQLVYDSPSLIPEGYSLFYRSRLRAVLANIDAEVGFPILRDPISLYVALGSYYLFGRSIRSCDFGNAWGGKTRLVAKIYDGIEVSFDTYFDRYSISTRKGS